MLVECLLATAFQIGPLYQQKPEYRAVRPFYSSEGETTDVLWPVFTAHRDWWRFCYFVEGHGREGEDGQFSLMPLWWNGRDDETGPYWALFPFYGRHPHFALMYDIEFALWPLWMRYEMPRPSTGERLVTNTVLFPFFSWRSDGSWSAWPVYGVNRRRESDHRYALWPLVTWADYREDRDTAGEGHSWMVWPLYGRVRRERERQDLFLPPFFSVATAWNRVNRDKKVNSFPESFRLRCPWPFFEYECVRDVRERISVWPFYEHAENRTYATGEVSSSVTRFGWKLVELYDRETRVFPFYAHGWGTDAKGRGNGYLRVWPFWESTTEHDVTVSRALALFPIRWVPAVDRNWAKFWTFYESESNPVYTDRSLLWGIIRWRTVSE